MNDDLLDSELQSIFDNQELKTSAQIIILDSARKKSVGAKPVERIVDKKEFSMDAIRVSLVSIMVAATLLAGSVNLTDISINLNSKLNMHSLSKEIGSIVYNESDNERTSKISIVSQNTHGNQGMYYYKQDDIAKDLITLDSSLFDYAFCAVCNDMGNNIYNQVGIGGRSNIDAVIYYLKYYSGIDGTFYNEYVSEAFRDVSSLEEYLIKNNYVDKAGNPSFEVFKQSCNLKAEDIYSILQNSNNKGVNM